MSAALLAGCAIEPAISPALPLSVADGRAALAEMRGAPQPLDRPVVVLGGIYDPGFVAPSVERRVRDLTHPEAPTLAVSFFAPGSFDADRDRLIAAVDEAFGEAGEDETIEVDVIAYSMGGLVARHAARPRDDGKRLNIARLFTVGTPHRGARLAAVPWFDQRAGDMRTGSEFLAALDADFDRAAYECVAYVREGDFIVGDENASPHGQPVILLSRRPWEPAHLTMNRDPRILADIARRLRGEEPYTDAVSIESAPCHATDEPLLSADGR